MRFAAQYHEAYVLCMGDSNLLLDPLLDRHGGPLVSQPQDQSAFRKLVAKFGWHDQWRVSNPHARAYSWSIPARECLSRIDLAFGNDKALTKVSYIAYLPRGVSDHAPLLLTLDIQD